MTLTKVEGFCTHNRNPGEHPVPRAPSVNKSHDGAKPYPFQILQADDILVIAGKTVDLHFTRMQTENALRAAIFDTSTANAQKKPRLQYDVIIPERKPAITAKDSYYNVGGCAGMTAAVAASVVAALVAHGYCCGKITPTPPTLVIMTAASERWYEGDRDMWENIINSEESTKKQNTLVSFVSIGKFDKLICQLEKPRL
ncbi:hypothetical protein Y032_0143g2415 [Ancylostoma ceylanicum]|uniref:Uncharacterized protein n=1 Tax=Ancylostoma ceylanicum TaxID=53326 RepID=A0A016T2E6_9BILA|nr:hypothetical protein Y032_0143g2415 [Ancylostoma ceylanicum]